MKSVRVYSESHGFAYIDGRLIECEIKKMEICFIEKNRFEINLVVAHADWTEKISDKDFYRSVEDFRNNIHRSPSEELWLRSRLPQLAGEDSDGNNFTYIIENGRVKKYVVEFQTIEVYYENGFVHHVESSDMPEVCYALEEAARSHISLEIVNADGSIKTIPSAASLVALTDGQKAVVNEIVKLSKKAHDMGIRIVTDWNGTYAFNASDVKDYCIEYEEEDGYERVDLLSHEFAIDFDIITSSDENMLNIQRMEEA